jgi:hypothetical protein
MRTVAVVLWALVAQAACTRASDPDPPKAPAAAQSPTVKTLMKDHEKHGAAMRDAVARNDLAGAKREARVLAGMHLEGSIDPVWKTKLDAMNIAASRVAGAQDIKEAAHDLGGVAKTCGDCHTMLNRPGPAVSSFEARGSGAGPMMMQHEWAANRLWDGLAVPSDDAWKAGARTLSSVPLAPEVLTPGKSPVPKVGAMIERVHELGRTAERADSVDARVQIYGETMSTCADCHRWLR